MVKKSLGKGLGALIPTLPKMDKLELSEIPIEKIKTSKLQPRHVFHDSSIDELATSIREIGIVQPIIVRNTGNDFELIAGERRFRAAQKAGLTSIPALVKSKSDVDALKIALVENMQREDLNIVDEALGLRSLAEDHKLTHDEISLVIGSSRSKVSNTLRILSLPEEILEMLRKDEISAGHARALLTIEDKKKQLELAKAIQNDDLSVRNIEGEVKRLKTDTGKKTKAPVSADPDLEKLQRSVSNIRSAAVKAFEIENKGGHYYLNMKFKKPQELEYFLAKLKHIL